MIISGNANGSKSLDIRGIAKYLISGMVSTMIGCALLATFVYTNVLKINYQNFCGAIILVSAMIGTNLIKERASMKRSGITICLGAMSYFVILYFVNILIFKAKPSGVFETGISIIGGTILGLIIKIPGKHKERSYKKRRKFNR